MQPFNDDLCDGAAGEWDEEHSAPPTEVEFAGDAGGMNDRDELEDIDRGSGDGRDGGGETSRSRRNARPGSSPEPEGRCGDADVSDGDRGEVSPSPGTLRSPRGPASEDCCTRVWFLAIAFAVVRSARLAALSSSCTISFNGIVLPSAGYPTRRALSASSPFCFSSFCIATASHASLGWYPRTGTKPLFSANCAHVSSPGFLSPNSPSFFSSSSSSSSRTNVAFTQFRQGATGTNPSRDCCPGTEPPPGPTAVFPSPSRAPAPPASNPPAAGDGFCLPNGPGLESQSSSGGVAGDGGMSMTSDSSEFRDGIARAAMQGPPPRIPAVATAPITAPAVPSSMFIISAVSAGDEETGAMDGSDGCLLQGAQGVGGGLRCFCWARGGLADVFVVAAFGGGCPATTAAAGDREVVGEFSPDDEAPGAGGGSGGDVAVGPRSVGGGGEDVSVRFRFRPKSRLPFSYLLVALADREDSAPVFAASSEEASPISTSCFGVERACSDAGGDTRRHAAVDVIARANQTSFCHQTIMVHLSSSEPGYRSQSWSLYLEDAWALYIGRVKSLDPEQSS